MVSATAPVTARRGITRLRRIEEHVHARPADSPAPRRSFRRRLSRWVLGGAVLLMAGAWLWLWQTRVVAPGTVEGDAVTLTAPAPVIVEEVPVEPGQWCEKGQPLVRLVARNVDPQRLVLEAQLMQKQARLDLVKHGASLEDLHLGQQLDDRDRLATEMGVAEAALAAAHARFEHARRELAVYTSLRESSQSSAREVDAAETAVAIADADLNLARATFQGLRTRWETLSELAPTASNGVELRQVELALLEDGVLEAERRLQQSDFQAGTRTLVAPFSGRVDRIHVSPGSYREQGDPLLSMYDPASLYVVAYVKPVDRERIHTGTPVRMFPFGTSQPISGVVREIHQAWSPIPRSVAETAQYSGTAITVRIECDERNRTLLVPGMFLKTVSQGR